MNTAIITTMCRYVLCHNTGACSYILPKAMSAASLYLQSELLILSLTKGRTNGTMSSSQHVASSMRQTPAALLGFQSSSSSYSSCNVNFVCYHFTIKCSTNCTTCYVESLQFSFYIVIFEVYIQTTKNSIKLTCKGLKRR